MKDLLHTLDATAQSELVNTGKISAEELVDAAISRINKLNPQLNALACTDFERAKERARSSKDKGLFSGVPTLIKDTNSYPGLPYEMGSRLFRGNIGQQNFPYIEALEQEGIIVIGKSTTSELALLGTTESMACGPTRNPFNLNCSPGGSSGGAVAAVASGMVPVAHASDGGGSIRGPASLGGLFGFKPTRGSTVFSGIPQNLPTAFLISDHCVSRSVRDSEAWFQITRSSPPTNSYAVRTGKRKLKIGYYLKNSFGMLPSEDVQSAFKKALKLCQDLGHELVEVKPPEFDAPEAANLFFILSGKVIDGLIQQMKTYMGSGFNEALLEPYTLHLWEQSRAHGNDVFEKSAKFFGEVMGRLNRSFDTYDLLLSPTTPFTAFPIGEFDPTSNPEKLMRHTKEIASYTVVASIAGWSAMTVPLSSTIGGLPIGIHFASKIGNDDLLFDLAYQLEEANPWQPMLTKRIEELLCLKS